MRDLVVTADDMGLRDDYDSAVVEAHARGVVTSASIVTNGASYREAKSLLRSAGLDHGVHLNLLEGEPLSPREEVRSLIDDRGHFPGGVARFLARWAAGRVRAREVAIEWERQIRRALDDGLAPSHLNSHYHLHALPGLTSIVFDLARRFDIHWVRVPDEPPWHAARASAAAKAGALWVLARRSRRRIAGARLAGIPCRGIVASGALGRGAWRDLLRRLPEGAAEVACHPGQAPEETEALSSRDLRREIEAHAALRSFRELDAARRWT